VLENGGAASRARLLRFLRGEIARDARDHVGELVFGRLLRESASDFLGLRIAAQMEQTPHAAAARAHGVGLDPERRAVEGCGLGAGLRVESRS
jgi:hypothetical protein